MNVLRKILRSGLSPGDAIKNFQKHLKTLVEIAREGNDTDNAERLDHAKEKVADDLAQIRYMILGEPENPSEPQVAAKIVNKLLGNEAETSNLMEMLTYGHLYLPDAQKSMAVITNFIIGKNISSFKEVFYGKYDVLINKLLEVYVGSSQPRLQIQMSSILREIMKDQELHAHLLYECPDLRRQLFENVKQNNFDVSSDAFTTLKTLLTRNKSTISAYLQETYTEFFKEYNELILSKNYVTKRQSLKLLGDVLLDKENKQTMLRYIGEKPNLKLLMIMLRDDSKAITYEAFHVFKVFVANPHKQPEVYSTLYKNKQRLIDFLQQFQTAERQDDEQFNKEKSLLINTLTKMNKEPDVYKAWFEQKEKNKRNKRGKERTQAPRRQ